MDELTLLRRLEARTPPTGPSDAVLTSARDTLLQHIRADEETRSSPAGRRWQPNRRLVLGGVGLIAATGVVALVLEPAVPPSASASMAQALRVAASAAPPEHPAAGDIVTHDLGLVSTSSGRVRKGNEVFIDSGVLWRYTVTLHPVPGTGEWVRSWSTSVPVAAYGYDSARQLEKAKAEPAEIVPDEHSATRGADFWNGPHSLPPARVAAMSRDPETLLRQLAIGTDDPESHLMPSPQRTIEAAANLLGSGLADPQLQRATYEALLMADGLTVDRRGHDIDGRPGTTFSTVVSNGQQRFAVTMDPATGRYLGLSEVNLPEAKDLPGAFEEGTAVYTG